jgi:hypothetical protein
MSLRCGPWVVRSCCTQTTGSISPHVRSTTPWRFSLGWRQRRSLPLPLFDRFTRSPGAAICQPCAQTWAGVGALGRHAGCSPDDTESWWGCAPRRPVCGASARRAIDRPMFMLPAWRMDQAVGFVATPLWRDLGSNRASTQDDVVAHGIRVQRTPVYPFLISGPCTDSGDPAPAGACGQDADHAYERPPRAFRPPTCYRRFSSSMCLCRGERGHRFEQVYVGHGVPCLDGRFFPVLGLVRNPGGTGTLLTRGPGNRYY